MTRLFPSLANNRKAAIFAAIGIGIVLFMLPIVAGYFGNFWVRVMAMALLYAIPEALRIWAKPAQEMLFGHEYIAPEALRMLLFRPSGIMGERVAERA